MNKCNCEENIELVHANEPWNCKFWICTKCDSTYPYEEFDFLVPLDLQYEPPLIMQRIWLSNEEMLKRFPNISAIPENSQSQDKPSDSDSTSSAR